ncbi:MAG: rod shape-determining protein MreD [Chitinophagales bacterium]|nr:rod shape-determining protein MreD [Chitinophagales bacterium]
MHIVRFILLVLGQVLILNNIHLHGLFNPYIYPLFILLLPFQTSRGLQLLLAFLLGLVIDFYSGTGGLHASALTVVAFLRPYLIIAMKPNDGYQPEDRPTISSMGFTWFSIYASILIFVHHLYFFIIETLSLQQIFFVFSKIIISAAVSVLLMILLQYVFYRRKKTRLV